MENIDLARDRAWIEINLNNLENNINEIKKLLSEETKIMAVVKANAYGHGSVIIAKKLLDIGITDFAVATLDEGIELRKNGITGNILILGFTNFSNLKYVIEYDLIQTIVDYNYSERIKELDLKDKLKCHIKINTGMNRIGENCDSLDKLYSIYENKKLNILGSFSHLCVADSSNLEDIDFTKIQIKKFNECVKAIKDKGYNTGALHLQSSYGIINYNELNYDYVRVGICMYGVNTDFNPYQLNNLNIKPILAVKARITSIKEINIDDSISYGRTFIAKDKMKIATLGIGYADGIPRCLSNKDMLVNINEEYKKVIGRICMDQMIIDITGLENVKVGDIATLIGNDKRISAETVSNKAETITNELLCRLGSRLRRITI